MIDWNAVLMAAGGAGGGAGILRILIAGWLKRREDHEVRMETFCEKTRSDIGAADSKHQLLEARVLRLEGDVLRNRREYEEHAERVEKKLDAMLARLGNLTLALAARGFKVRGSAEEEGDPT